MDIGASIPTITSRSYTYFRVRVVPASFLSKKVSDGSDGLWGDYTYLELEVQSVPDIQLPYSSTKQSTRRQIGKTRDHTAAKTG